MADDNVAAHDPWTDGAFEQAVRDTAYFLWEHDGRPAGREQEYWFRALEQCLRERQNDQLLREQPPGTLNGAERHA